MSVDADSVLVFGVRVSQDDFWYWIDKYTKGGDILPDEFIDDWYHYITRIDSYSDESEWLIGIHFATIAPIKESLDYGENKAKFAELLSSMFPFMPLSTRFLFVDQSGFISTVRWH